MVKQWCFSQLDTWFFKEARPFDSVGATQLDTISLPPPARTVAGAIRHLIGRIYGINWKDFHANHELAKEIGYSDDLGKLQLTGPYLLLDNKRLYPVPLTILESKSDSVQEDYEPKPIEAESVKFNKTTKSRVIRKNPEKAQKVEEKLEKKTFDYLRPGNHVKCDLGTVRLPEKSKELKGAKPIEDAWLNQEDFKRVLSGKFPEKIIYNKDLFEIENRVGIALDTNTRITKEHQLYQTQHIRIHHNKKLQVGMQVDGIQDEFHPTKMDLVNFGGEGRLAEVLIETESNKLETPVLKDEKHIFLTLLTAADLGNNWLPKGFVKLKCDKNEDAWYGEIKEVKLKIISAVLGKSIREGGWDLVRGQSRPVVSLVPAGSVWFCEVIKGDPKTLHGKKIGKDTALGRGELAVGKWEERQE